MRLWEAPLGSRVVVVSVNPGEGGQGRRLEDVGFVPGTVVRVERRAPLRDPTVYDVRDTKIALRRAGADLVEVRPVVGTDAIEPAPSADPVVSSEAGDG